MLCGRVRNMAYKPFTKKEKELEKEFILTFLNNSKKSITDMEDLAYFKSFTSRENAVLIEYLYKFEDYRNIEFLIRTLGRKGNIDVVIPLVEFAEEIDKDERISENLKGTLFWTLTHVLSIIKSDAHNELQYKLVQLKPYTWTYDLIIYFMKQDYKKEELVTKVKSEYVSSKEKEEFVYSFLEISKQTKLIEFKSILEELLHHSKREIRTQAKNNLIKLR